jgi:4-amino-4-deoxy-L-arabinose transferase-like glycosyltransferase
MFMKFRFDIYDLLLLVLLIIFVFIKIPYLTLPFYWDEAWVYGPALRIMESKHLSLLPDALPVYYSRGHPLLFHFLGALWLRIFGTSLLSSHIFALTISICLIISVYVFCSKLLSKPVGLAASLILALQPIFLAQSVLVLPEVMISLFSLLSIFFFLKQKWIGYVIFTTFALYTKETGIVVVAATGIWFLIETLILKRKEFSLKKFIRQCLILLVPIIFISIFFVIQKKMNGWYFFPEHVNYLENDSRSFANKFESYFAYVFIYWGRNMLSTLLIISLFFYFFLKKFRNNKANRPLLLLSIFIILFLVASSMNFYSDRYALCMIAPFIIITLFLVHEVIKRKIFFYLVIAAYSILQITIHIPIKTSSDHNLGYAESVKTHQQMVNYCIENNFRNKIIFTHFLMLKDLTDPYSGYISDAEKFPNVSSIYTDSTELCIFSNMEGKEDYEKIKAEGNIKILKRFESHQAWSEIYEVVKK